MRLMVTLRLDGAAFDTDPGAECARILRELAERIANGALVESEQGIILRDENGNACGEAASAR